MYFDKYPNLIESREEGFIWADLEIRGMAKRTDQERQQKLQWVQNMISRCLSAERYHEGMQEDVNGALMCQAISAVEETFRGIPVRIR